MSPERGKSMTHKCKSGQHTWIFKEDAEKAAMVSGECLCSMIRKHAITWSWISCPAVCPMDTGGCRYDGFGLERARQVFQVLLIFLLLDHGGAEY
jgi:hypothetical protein